MLLDDATYRSPLARARGGSDETFRPVLHTPAAPAPRRPVERDEVDEVAEALSRARRARSRNRLIAVALLLALAGALWLTRALWRPLVISSDAYDATPAQTFPVGEAGFVLPEVHPVDGMSAAAVAGALTRARTALIDSYLDPRLLTGHDPESLLGLLAPDSAVAVRPRLATGGYGTTLVRFAPGVHLTAAPRVNGTLHYARVDWNGMPALDVTSNYVVAYALSGDPARPGDVVVVHAVTHWMFPLATALRVSSKGMYLGRTSGYWHGMDCAAAGRGLTAPVPSVDQDAKPAYQDPDPLDAYFDRHRPVGITSACR